MIIKKCLFLVFLSIFIMFPYFFYDFKQAIIGILILVLFGMLNWIIFFAVSVYSLVINIFYFHIFTHWGNLAISSRIEAALESPSYEQLEYIKSYFNVWDIFNLSFLLLSIIFLVYFNRKYKKIVCPKKIILSMIVIIFTILAIPAQPNTIKTLQIIHFPLTFLRTYQRLQTYSQRNQFINTLSAKKDSNISSIYNKIIIIQGEAVNKNHMAIYGYKKETTPFLSSIKIYKINAISPTNQTRYSIPIELTKATVDNFNKFYKSPSIVSVFKNYGYSTYWISNQGQRGVHDTSITSMAKEADHISFLNELDYSTAKLDSGVLSVLDKISINNTSKQMFVIHLLGSHVKYNKRYPSNYRLLSDNNIVNAYDNSIYYTDYILSEIYKRFPKDTSLFIYLSDHGEVVDDNLHGHGFFPSYKDEYEIPLIIFGKGNMDRINKLKKNTNGKILNTECFDQIIMYLAGFINDVNISYSSTVFSLKPKNIIDYKDLKYYKNQEE